MKITLPVDINDLVLKDKLTDVEKELVRCAASFEALEYHLVQLRRVYDALPESVRQYMKMEFPEVRKRP